MILPRFKPIPKLTSACPRAVTPVRPHAKSSSSFDSALGRANFDRIAHAYRWLEYLSLGNLLERVRFWPLEAGYLKHSRQALVLGDGDGRFTARMMQQHRALQVHAVDLSPLMLDLLQHRCRKFLPRLTTQCVDARDLNVRNLHAQEPNAQEMESRPPADLVVTHFFLDCLKQAEVRHLLEQVSAVLKPEALWVVSEFCVPRRGWLRLPAWLLVRGLYLAFCLLTGLRVTRLPDYSAEFHSRGFQLLAEKHLLGGLLVSQVWKAPAISS